MHILAVIDKWHIEDENGDEPDANEYYAVQEELHLPSLHEFEVEDGLKVSEIDAFIKQKLQELYKFMPERFWWKENKKESDGK